MSTKKSRRQDPAGAQTSLALTDFLTYQLYHLAQQANRAGQRWHQQHSGLSLTEWRLLATLCAFGPTTSATLAERLQMDKAAVSRAKSALIDRDILREVAVRDDSRKREIAVTRRGNALYARTWPLVQARQQALLALLDDDERAAFGRAAAKLGAYFDEYMPTAK